MDPMRRCQFGEVRPTCVFGRGLDAKDPLVSKSIEAGPFTSLVLSFIDLWRFETSEHSRAGLAFDQQGDAGIFRSRDITSHFTHPEQRVAQGAVFHKKLRKGAQTCSDRVLVILHCTLLNHPEQPAGPSLGLKEGETTQLKFTLSRSETSDRRMGTQDGTASWPRLGTTNAARICQKLHRLAVSMADGRSAVTQRDDDASEMRSVITSSSAGHLCDWINLCDWITWCPGEKRLSGDTTRDQGHGRWPRIEGHQPRQGSLS